MAYDLFGKSGTAVRNPMPGRVVNISGRAGGSPRFAGYGVTVDYGGGRQAFYKHLGNLGPGVRVGATIPRGALIGGLDGATAGGPHLHLGATNRGFLQSLLSFYGAG
jgi:murein DD-endopeptidase MepM/ murein hydrolase activator NlpD